MLAQRLGYRKAELKISDRGSTQCARWATKLVPRSRACVRPPAGSVDLAFLPPGIGENELRSFITFSPMSVPFVAHPGACLLFNHHTWIWIAAQPGTGVTCRTSRSKRVFQFG